MEKKARRTSAVEILHRRFIGDDGERKASLQEERVNAEVAQTIYELRKEAELTQKELADLVGTTQSVISRLEDADYEGHSLSMLHRIAKSLNQRIVVQLKTGDPNRGTRRYVFREVVRGLRRKRRLTPEELAAKLGLDRNEVIAMERQDDYRPSPLTLFKLGKFYGISQQNLAILAGAISDASHEFQQEVSKFAAQSESFAKLTREEQQILDEFIKFLKAEIKTNDRRQDLQRNR
jgi:transcriptional regulator with XRE-family HTH domain